MGIIRHEYCAVIPLLFIDVMISDYITPFFNITHSIVISWYIILTIFTPLFHIFTFTNKQNLRISLSCFVTERAPKRRKQLYSHLGNPRVTDEFGNPNAISLQTYTYL